MSLQYVFEEINALKDKTDFLDETTITQAKQINKLEKIVNFQGKVINSLLESTKDQKGQKNPQEPTQKNLKSFAQRIKQKDDGNKYRK